MEMRFSSDGTVAYASLGSPFTAAEHFSQIEKAARCQLSKLVIHD